MDMHWKLLNVLGLRLRANPEVVGTIVGTGSGDEMISRAGNEIALGRAEGIRRYLQEVWGIDTARLRLAVRSAPLVPSSEETPDGRAENRRVEFGFSESGILAPVVVSRLATIASPPAVVFDQTITADTTVAEWRLSVVQGEKELLRFAGGGEEESFEEDKLWSLADLRVNRDLTEIRYRLEVRDVTGQTAVADGRFRVVERRRRNPADTLQTDTELTEHYLVGFNFNSSELLVEHRERLETIASTIDSTSEVLIIGYTDKLGDVERNRQLSLERATVVFNALRQLQMDRSAGRPASYVVRGYGPREELFNNAIPEGRIFSRMVRIVVTSTRTDQLH
jgi:outer membrane protein OmpA-like peptidoglycan-associated protein